MPKTIAYETLDLRDALDLAMLIEEEARERYEEFVAQMESTESAEPAAFFRFMAENEAKHGSAIAERRTMLFGHAPIRVDRSMLWEEEAPAYETVRAFMSPREAMEVALAAERKAQAFFAALVPRVTDAAVKALLEELRNEEVEHEQLVARQLAKLPAPPPSPAADYADEPVAQ